MASDGENFERVELFGDKAVICAWCEKTIQSAKPWRQKFFCRDNDQCLKAHALRKDSWEEGAAEERGACARFLDNQAVKYRQNRNLGPAAKEWADTIRARGEEGGAAITPEVAEGLARESDELRGEYRKRVDAMQGGRNCLRCHLPLRRPGRRLIGDCACRFPMSTQSGEENGDG